MNLTSIEGLIAGTQLVNLIFMRVIGFLLIVPYLSDYKVPKKVLIILALIISYILAGNIAFTDQYLGKQTNQVTLITGLENMFVGFVYGVAVLMATNFIHIAGKVIAFAMQMGFAQMVDPVNGQNSDTVSKLIFVIFSLCFMDAYGIVFILEIFESSFVAYPLFGASFEEVALLDLAKSLSLAFLYGVMMAIPFMGVGLLINVALAVISKSAPSMNLFSIGFPLAIVLGIIGLMLSSTDIISDLMIFFVNLKDKYLMILK